MYNNRLLSIFFIIICNVSYSQVGIGTTNPSSKLDIKSSSITNPLNTDGILIPRMNNFPSTNPTTAQDGMLVFVTGNGTPNKGFYYWNQPTTTWNPIGGNSGVKIIDDLLDGKSDNDGSNNGSSIFLGINAGLNDDQSNNKNVGIGFEVLKSNTTGQSNTSIGVNTLRFNTTGSFNIAEGSRSLFNLTVGNKNTAIGFEAMFSSTAAYRNTVSGYRSMYSNTTGTYNTALGYESGFTNTNGSYNVFLGYNAGYNSIGSNKLYIENRNANENNALIYGEFGNDATSIGNILRTNSQFQIGNPALTGYAFPTSDGTNGQVLQTNGGGTISWASSTSLGTDNQNLIGATLTGTSLQIDIENGTSTTVDLTALQDGGAKKINDLLDGKSNATGTTVFLGQNAGLNDNGANNNNNVGVGVNALKVNSTGFNNVAVGSNALTNNTSSGNTAVGAYSLNFNTGAGIQNTAVGNYSLMKNTTGKQNTAVGYLAGGNLTTGVNNTLMGYGVLNKNTIGINNTAFGFAAGFNNVTGNGNVFLGRSAGYWETGSEKLYVDNSGADANNALIYGEFGNYNTSVGNVLRTNSKFQIGNPALTGYEFPTIDGAINQVLQTDGNGAVLWANSNTIGTDNQNLIGATLTGASLQIDIENGTSITVDLAGLQDGGAKKINDLTDGKSDNDGTQNGSSVFLGVQSGLNDDSNNRANVGIGFQSLFYSTTGSTNTALGYQSLFANTTGRGNTAQGFRALYSNFDGQNNTSMGYFSLNGNITGWSNTALGYNSSLNNITGTGNTSVGYNSLYGNYGGSYNTAVGMDASSFNTNMVNTTSIGYQAITTANNQVRIGNGLVTSIGGFANWTNVSDARFKTNIKEDVKGLGFILKLRPVTYNLDLDKIEQYLKIPDSIKNDHNGELNKYKLYKEKEKQSGFIAQEVEQAAQELNYDFSGIDKPKNENDYYGLRYAEFVVPLVKAVQEQNEIIVKLTKENIQKAEEVSHLRKELEEQKDRIDKLYQLIEK